jgi:hypothetical protein
MKSIGYYYEDEDEYDMKTMYINDAYDGAGIRWVLALTYTQCTCSATDGRSSAAAGTNQMSVDPAAKDEMFERLRRINQHMYR